ncbi:hypothetical protein [Cetobacterium sp.]
MKKMIRLFVGAIFLLLYSYIFICVMIWCFLGAPKGQLVEIILRLA